MNLIKHLRGFGRSRGYGPLSKLVNVCAVLTFLMIAPLAGQASANDETKVLLALGDSLTAGYGLDQKDAFPVQLQNALQSDGHNVEVINGGVSGDTSAGGRSRLEWLLATPVDGVIVELGANDGLRGVDPAQTRENLDWILMTLKQRNIPVVFTGMLAPPNLGEDYGREFNSIYPDLAKKYDVVFDPFFLEGVAAMPELNQKDGIHPNAEGVSIIVQRIKNKIAMLFN